MSFQFQSGGILNFKHISHEILEELLLELAVKNQKRIESCNNVECIWSSDVAEFVFNTCEQLNLKWCVKYLALEIYERFVVEHIIEIRQKYSELRKTNMDSNWENIENRIRDQSTLRLMTAIELASKLDSHYQHVLPKQVSAILKKCGKPFSLNGIFSSELRVMKTLKYKINVATPALYLELLLYILYVNNPNIDESLYESTITVLDFVYLHRSKLYDELYDAVAGPASEIEKDFNHVFTRIKADYMLLATAMIAASAYMFLNANYEVILEQLHQITRKFKEDIRNFSVVIAYVVMNNICE